jgi:hypothetical protein
MADELKNDTVKTETVTPAGGTAEGTTETATPTAGDAGLAERLATIERESTTKTSWLRSVLVMTAAVLLVVPIPVTYLTVKVLLFVALIYGSVFSLKNDWVDKETGKLSRGAWTLSVVSSITVVLCVTFLFTKVAWMLQALALLR